MAIVSIEFDTNEKSMTCKVDGKTIENVSYVCLGLNYSDEDAYSCSIETSTKDEEHDMRIVTRMVASESRAGQELIKARAHRGALLAEAEGFVVEAKTQVTQVEKDIAAYFGK